MIAIPDCQAHHTLGEAFYHHLMKPENRWMIHQPTPNAETEWARLRARGSLGSYYDSFRGMKALVDNMPLITQTFDASDLVIQGEAALLVGAGPSLDVMIDTPEFQEATEKCFVVVCDTVYDKMKARGFKIDLVVTSERTALTSDYLKNVAKGTPLLRTVVSNPELNTLPAQHIFMLKADVPTRFFPWVKRKNYNCGVSVAPTALGYLTKSNIPKIAMVGIDLCYHPETLDSHCALDRKDSEYSKGVDRNQRLKEGCREVALARGGKSLTHHYWDTFAYHIEVMAPKKSEYELINCSPLARAIHKIPNKPLKDFVATLQTPSRFELHLTDRSAEIEEWIRFKQDVKKNLLQMPSDFTFMIANKIGILSHDCLVYHYSKAEHGKRAIHENWAAGYAEGVTDRLKEDLWWLFT